MSTASSEQLRWWEWVSLPTLLTTLVYTMGWSYAYGYFSAFHIGLLAVDLPGQYFIIYGFWVLQDYWGLVVLYIAAVLFWWFSRWWKWRSHVLVLAVVPLLLVAMFVVAYQLAHRSGLQDFRAQQQADYPAYPRVKVWLKQQSFDDANLQASANLLPSGCFRLLLQNRGTLVLFYTRPDQPTAQPAILQVPTGTVQAWRVLPQYRSCS